ncbi:hypothetical protein BC829DRAFT_89513 [Chytridium lagenaria]|nr:hypothetical protein BC829DRAFT_89513 [Chytridium lagenaria]
MSTGLAGWSSWATRPGVHALQLGVVAIAGTAALAYMLAPMRGPKKLSRKLSSKKSRKPSVLASPAAVTRELPVTAPIKESEVVADPPNPKVVSENQDVKVSSDKAPVQTPVVVDVSMKEVNSPVPEVTSKETSVCDQPDADKIASAVIPEEPSFSPSETTCLGTSKSNEAVSKVVSERQEDVEVLFSCDKHDIDNVYAFQALRHESPIPVGSELAFALPAVVPINVEAEVDVAVPVAVADAPAPTVDIVKQENAKVLFSCDKNDVAKVYAFQMLRYESPLPASSELAFILPAIVPVKEVEADAVAVADAPVSTVVSGKQEDVNHDVEVLEEPVQIPLDVDLPTESVKVDIPMAVPEVVSEETFASEQHDSDEIAVAVVPEEPPSSPSGSTCCGSSKSSDHSSSPVKAAF